MFGGLKWLRPAPAPVPPMLPAGQRAYAIGDVHGRADLFDDLLARIDEDDRIRGPAESVIVLLGDLVDRGPDSAGVVARAVDLQRSGRPLRALKGNHEEVLLAAIDGDTRALHLLLKIGGVPTLESYGLEPESLDAATMCARIASAIPGEHIDFLRAMEDQVTIGDYLFVHAGIRPGVPFADQKGADLRWIRSPFLEHSGHHGAMVVHGHTIVHEPELLANRLGIDTGAYASGVLTALGLENEERWLLQT